MTCEMCVNYGFYEMVTSGKPFGYSGVIPCFTCKRYCNLNDKFVSKEDGGNKDMKKEIVKYEVSKDGVGLLGFFEDGTCYHIHSDEMTKIEKQILKWLLEHSGSAFSAEIINEHSELSAIENRLRNLKEVTKVQCSRGNYDVNGYMRGMANGLILAEAIMEDKDPKYCEANYPEKDRFLKYPRKGDFGKLKVKRGGRDK